MRLLAFFVLASGCATDKVKCASQASVGVTHDQVDILFVLDDSPSTSPKINELKFRFPNFLKILDDLGAAGNPVSYHIGVVTPDLGAGPAASPPSVPTISTTTNSTAPTI